MTIKELRLEKKMTLAEFAKSIGIGMSTLTAYEAGKRGPNAKALAAVKDVYGVDLAAAEATPAKKPAGKAAAKKAAPAAVKAKAEEKTAKKTPRKKKNEPQIVIQSPLGGEITPFAILAKVGDVDKVYVRVDMNKAYWVKGTETGSVDLW